MTLTLDTPHFTVRTLEVTDAGGKLRDWFADPEIMFPLNLPHRLVPLPDMAAYIGGFDRRTRFLLGIEQKRGGVLCGFWIIKTEPRGRTATLDLMVDPRLPTAALAAMESMVTVGDWLAGLGVEKGIANMRPENRKGRRLMQFMGVPEEGLLREEVPEQTGLGGRLDIHRFGLPARLWPATRARILDRLEALQGVL